MQEQRTPALDGLKHLPLRMSALLGCIIIKIGQTQSMRWEVAAQLLSRVQLFVTLMTAARQASPSYTISPSWLKHLSFESVMPSSRLIFCLPFLLVPSNFPSIWIFSSKFAVCIRWPKYWSFNFSIRPSNECSGLISFRVDWLDLLVVLGILKSLLQYHGVSIGNT